METKMTENQSIDVITEMITRARRNFSRRNVYPTLFWGYVIATIAIIVFGLLLVLPPSAKPYAYYLWLVAIPANIFWSIYHNRLQKKADVTTHIDHIAGSIWGGFGISIFIVWVIVALVTILSKSNLVWWLITPAIMTMVGAATFATAKCYKMKLMTWSAVIFWVGALLSLVPYIWGSKATELGTILIYQASQFVVLAVAMITGFIIPAYVTLRKLKSDV